MQALQLSQFTPRVASLARAARTTRASARMAATARAAEWFPGTEAPAHLDGKLAGDYGFDPLGLGQNPDNLRWYREAELQNGRWSMLAVAGILGQEIINPSVFFYDAPTKVTLPFNILGLVAVEFLAMHYVEIRRWRDFEKPGSVDRDPLFPGNALPPHEVGYPGGIFDPMGMAKGDVKAQQLKEIKNARLAMLAFAGMIMSAQVTGKGPIANLIDHVSDPWNTSIMAKAVVLPGVGRIAPECAIAAVTTFQGIDIPTPCLLQGLWP